MMDQQASVKNIEILQTTINTLKQNNENVFQKIEEDLCSKNRLLEDTHQEESVSNNLLMVAKGIEAEKLAELVAANAEMAEAVASGNPILIASATSHLVSAQQEHQEAKEHRERLEHRYELAQQCVSIAEMMYSEVSRSYSFLKTSIEEKSFVGFNRIFNAKNDLESYLSKQSNSIKNQVEPIKTKHFDPIQKDTISKHTLTKSQRKQIQEETKWEKVIIDHIVTNEQYEIYKKADLIQIDINERKCLVKKINLDFEDPKSGMTNRELMAKGRAPYDEKTGERIELHHMNQEFDGPFAELTENTEHGDGNQTILHLKGSDSWRNDTKKKIQYERHDRPEHWLKRLEELEKNG